MASIIQPKGALPCAGMEAPGSPQSGDVRASKRWRVLFVTDFYQEDLLAGVVEYVRTAGWELNASMRFHGVFPREAPVAVDGILATAVGLFDRRVEEWLARWKDCPIVRMMDSELELPYPAVEADYVAAGGAGARHLLDLGHVHYAFYWVEELNGTRAIRKGFELELAAAGRKAHRLDLFATFLKSGRNPLGRHERSHWLTAELKRLPKPLAVMGDDDRRALDLLAACDSAGLRVPEDVAILGCDNRAVEVGMSRIPISSVDVNFKRMGWEAAAMLDRLMQGRKLLARVIKVPPLGVVARRSTATFITESPEITAAVLHLREHFREPLRLEELARRAGLSKRTFELEFKQRVGRTAREELQRVRLACAARLLRDTELKLDAIAVESGFSSGRKLCPGFAEVYGLSPHAWRLRARNGF